MAGPPWLADEMVGRLARYLRMLGQDTAYVRGLQDAEIIDLASREGRTILTRDRGLAGRVPGTLLLTSTAIADQVREVHAAAPGLAWSPGFVRCTECNGLLVGVPAGEPAAGAPSREGLPRAFYRCSGCGHLYWEGTHTESVRKRVLLWLSEGSG